MISINQHLQAFFQMQQAFGSRSQPSFTHYSQHNEDEDEDEEEDEEDDYPHLGD